MIKREGRLAFVAAAALLLTTLGGTAAQAQVAASDKDSSVAASDPMLCNQYSFGKICITRSSTLATATYYNNSGGGKNVWLKVVRCPDSIVKTGSTVWVPAGSSTSLSYSIGNPSNLFKGAVNTLDGGIGASPCT